MAKKNKKSTKINQKIKHYFDGEPFDVGIGLVDSATLMELLLAIGVYDVKHSKETMLKRLRMLWSSGDISLRKDIFDFFKYNDKIYTTKKSKNNIKEKLLKIDELLKQTDATDIEQERLREIFLELNENKITLNKIESKLKYIRFEKKKIHIEELCKGRFDINDSFEFEANIKFEIFDESFSKILTIRTKTFKYDYLKESEIDEIKEKIEHEKKISIEQKQTNIDNFLKKLQNHRYLNKKTILQALKSMPSDTILPNIPLKENTIKNIIKDKLDLKDMKLYKDELLLHAKQNFVLPHSDVVLDYVLEINIELESLLEEIWLGLDIELSEILQELKSTQEEYFKQDLFALFKQIKNYAKPLQLSDEELRDRFYILVKQRVDSSLELTPKISKKIFRTFVFHTQDAIAKKQKQELFAKTIRDFKNLFPLARELKRKITLHIGPTNSGKTYEAMKKLKEADTGYYLAPLRLLALEGYEDLKQSGIDVSLITGEEQLINEDASHISSTIEMVDFNVDVDVCVIDEAQMIEDDDRGWAWANAIIGVAAKEVILTASPNTKDAMIEIASYLGEKLEIVEFERKSPLTMLQAPTLLKHVKKGSAIIAFSRRDVLRLKQRLSPFFSISVVYGNLSPEVRREEAKKFREGKSDILIATDAISMGLNLPIETILFSQATKFNGTKKRKLTPIEIHQISGRAGRFGLSEAGYVGALSKHVLKVIQNGFKQKAQSIQTPFKVMANLEHIKLVSSILEENSLEIILDFFVKNMEFSGPFVASNLNDMKQIAQMVDGYNLDIATKYHLSCAPVALNSPYILNSFERYVYFLEQKEKIYYKAPILRGKFAKTQKELLFAEDVVKEITLYLWLSYRFEDFFVDTQKAREFRVIANRYIEKSLR